MKSTVNDKDFEFQLYKYNDKKNASKLDKSQYIAQMFDDFYALRNVGKYKEIIDLETDVSPNQQIKHLYDLRKESYILKRDKKIEKKKERILYDKFFSESAKKAAAANRDDSERKNKKVRYEDDVCSSTSRSPKAYQIFQSSDEEDEEEIESVGHGFETPKKSPRMSERKVHRQYNTRSSKAEPLVLSSSDSSISSSSSDDSDDVEESE